MHMKLVSAILLLFMAAQNSARHTFEVASIRQEEAANPKRITGWNCFGFDQPDRGQGPAALAVLTVGRGRCRLLGWTVRRYVAVLYKVSEDRVIGAPSWASSLPYVIEAKADDALKPTYAQLLDMLKNLFEDRFKLKLHLEEKEVDGFELVVAAGGHKMKAAPPEARAGASGGMGSFKGIMNVAQIASFVSTQLGVPVTDGTALKERFDVSVTYTPGPGGPGYDANADPGPSIVSAIRDLGLRLEPKKARIQLIVIDSVEKPTLN